MNYTIKTLLFAMTASFLTMGGCLSKYTSANFDYHTEVQIQTNDLTTSGPQTFGESVLTSGLKAELENNNTSLDNLEELKLKSANVSLTNDSLGNFDNVENMELWLETDGSPEVLIASINPVPKGKNSVTLIVNNNENLANYIKADKFTYRIKGTNTMPLAPMELTINAIWTIKASAN